MRPFLFESLLDIAYNMIQHNLYSNNDDSLSIVYYIYRNQYIFGYILSEIYLIHTLLKLTLNGL